MNARIRNIFSLFSLFLATVLAFGCHHNPEKPDDDHMVTKKPRVPENTVGSFNFTKDSGIVIFDVNGKKAEFVDKPLPKNKKDAGTVTIKFVSGSCTAEVCRPVVGCKTVVLDPVNDCPAQ